MLNEKNDKKPMRILLDSTSLKSKSAQKLLNYFDNDFFEFVSLGDSKKHTKAEISFDDKRSNNEIVIDKSSDHLHGYKEHIGFNYRISDIKAISKSIDIKYDDLILVFILAELSHNVGERKTILVTERKKLLNRLNWIKNGFPRLFANSILSPDEAMIFIDLYCKAKNKYLIAPNFYANRGLWYLYSLKTKLPNYQQVWSVVVFGNKLLPQNDELMEIVASLGDRMTDMLMAIDEIGMNYYEDVNNDTQDSIIYHFNYWITLFTGVFDSLAWISKYRYQIDFDKFERIGLRKNRQKDFTKLLFKKNSKIKTFLSNNSSVINLMYDPRDLIIHRARLKGLRFDNRNENFYFNMIRIPKDFFDQIVVLSKEKDDTLGKWGHYQSNGEYFLEPYRFVKNATLKLIDFIDKYLDLLDFDEYKRTISELKKKIENSQISNTHKQFLQDLNNFDKYRLGY